MCGIATHFPNPMMTTLGVAWGSLGTNPPSVEGRSWTGDDTAAMCSTHPELPRGAASKRTAPARPITARCQTFCKFIHTICLVQVVRELVRCIFYKAEQMKLCLEYWSWDY